MVAVPDARLDRLSGDVPPKKTPPAVIEFVDIAGLVKARPGGGPGQQVPSNIRETHAIVHVVRCFDDENSSTWRGPHGPPPDIDIIDLELIRADVEMVEGASRRPEGRQGGQEVPAGGGGIPGPAHATWLNDGNAARAYELRRRCPVPHRHQRPAHTSSLSSTPTNLDEGGFSDCERSPNYRLGWRSGPRARGPGHPVCAKLERRSRSCPGGEALFLEDLGMAESGLDGSFRASYTHPGPHLLPHAGGRTSAGPGLSPGAPKAPQAAGKIHTRT